MYQIISHHTIFTPNIAKMVTINFKAKFRNKMGVHSYKVTLYDIYTWHFLHSSQPVAKSCVGLLYDIYHIISNHIKSFQIISNHIKSYQIKSNHIKSYQIISYHIISYHIKSYHIKSYCNYLASILKNRESSKIFNKDLQTIL